jgi:hypothetical protein
MSSRSVRVTPRPPSPKSCSQFIVMWELHTGRRMNEAHPMVTLSDEGCCSLFLFLSLLCPSPVLQSKENAICQIWYLFGINTTRYQYKHPYWFVVLFYLNIVMMWYELECHFPLGSQWRKYPVCMARPSQGRATVTSQSHNTGCLKNNLNSSTGLGKYRVGYNIHSWLPHQ